MHKTIGTKKIGVGVSATLAHSCCSTLAVIVALCVAAAPTPSLADTNITEHIMLAEDADWTSLGTVNIADGAGIHLNGRNLTVSSFSGDGSIYSSTLPAGYAALEYIESTGAQYIDTGVSPSDAVKIDADVAFTGTTGSSTYKALICASPIDSDRTTTAKAYGIWIWPKYSVSYWSLMFDGATKNSSVSVTSGTRCNVVAQWSASARTLAVDGTTVYNDATTASVTSTDNSMFLPAWNSNGTVRNQSEFRIYSFKIYNPQDTLVRDYVPVKRLSDNAVGLYDRVDGTFSPSATETAFVGGTEVERSGGELRINVESGAFTNSTVTISNSVKVVKLGAGTYTSNKRQYYTGGTDVNAGRIGFKSAGSPNNYSGFGVWGAAINVASNAQVVINGDNQTLNGYNVTIAGDGPDGNGAIYGNSKKSGGWELSYIGSLALSGDASITIAAEDAFNLNYNKQDVDIALNGHTLTANGTARFIVWSGNVVDSGRIVSNISPGSNGASKCFYTHGNGVSAPLADFEVPAGKALGGEAAVTVSNLVFGGTFYLKNEESPYYDVTVLGRYTPQATSGGFPNIVLGDASHLSPVFDLSGLSTTYDGSHGLAFASGSTVEVCFGERAVSSKNPVATWTTPPTDVTFVSAAGEPKRNFIVKDDGLYVSGGGMTLIFW